MSGWFEIHESENGTLQIFLNSPDGETLLSSGTFESLGDVGQQIELIRESCAVDENYEVKTSATGKLYFYLVSQGRVAGIGQLHRTLQDLKSNVEAVKANGPSSLIKYLNLAGKTR